MLQYQILPLLQERRYAVPIERMLENDRVVRPEQLLLAADIYVVIGIVLVEIVHRKARQLRQAPKQPPIYARFLKRRVCEEDEDAGHGSPGQDLSCRQRSGAPKSNWARRI
jgi:hypothetical protein